MKKKILAISLVVTLLAVAALGVTLAYFTDDDTATNVFTMGNVDIDLEEPSWDEPDYVQPGDSVAKDPYVKNIGANSAYVVLKVKIDKLDKLGASLVLTDLVNGENIGGDANDWTLVKTNPDNTNHTVEYVYVYNSVLAAGAETSRLFTSVEVPTGLTSDVGTFKMDITAMAIQSQNLTQAQALTELGV